MQIENLKALFQFPTPSLNYKMEMFKNCSHGILHVGNVGKNLGSFPVPPFKFNFEKSI